MEIAWKVYELVEKFIKGELDLKEALPLLILLALLGCFTFRKGIRRTFQRAYSRLRQEREIERLRKEVEEIRLRLYKPLRKLEEYDEDFKLKVDDILKQVHNICSRDSNNNLEEHLAIEVRWLYETYEESILEIKNLVEIISDSLDRADEMGVTREDRVKKATTVYRGEKSELQKNQSREN